MRAPLACVLLTASALAAAASPAPVAGYDPDSCALRFTEPDRRRLCSAAVGGDAVAQRGFARMLLEGLSVARDAHAAALLLRRAAEAGHPGAAGDLGRLYETGRGVPHDLSEAERWYRRAAEAGDAVAAWRLAAMLEPRAITEAIELLRRAHAGAEPLARSGDLDALFLTGANLIGEPISIVVRADIDQGMARLRRAADGGHVLAASVLGRFRLDAHERWRDLREARRLLAFAAERGDAPACIALARMLLATSGAGAAQEHLQAVRLLRCAADRGSADAAHVLGRIFANGYVLLGSSSATFAYGPFLRPDLAEARRWYARAAEAGHAFARYDLALMLLQGQGGPVDVPAALSLVRGTIAGRADGAELRNLAAAILGLEDPGREALEVARAAVEEAMRRRDPHLWVDTLALVHLRLGEAGRAEELLRAEIARRGDPDNVDVVRYRVALGDVLRAQGRIAEARAQWERVIPQVRGYMSEPPVRRRLAETTAR